MTTETTAAEARDAWQAAMATRDDHEDACCGCETVHCDERVRLNQAERETWLVYFELRVAEGVIS